MAALLVPVLAWLVFGDGRYFTVFLIYGLGVCALGGYWLGDRTWPLVPLLAMGAFLALALPTARLGRLGEELPLSLLLASPFWAGLPALVGSLIGVALRRLAVRCPRGRGADRGDTGGAHRHR